MRIAAILLLILAGCAEQKIPSGDIVRHKLTGEKILIIGHDASANTYKVRTGNMSEYRIEPYEIETLPAQVHGEVQNFALKKE